MIVSNYRIILSFLQIVFACLLVLAVATATTPSPEVGRDPRQIPILQDDRVYPSAAGEYSTDTETSDGMMIPASGYGSSPDGAMEFQVSDSFTFPDGQNFELPS